MVPGFIHITQKLQSSATDQNRQKLGINFLTATKGSNPQFLEHFSVNLARSAKIDNSSVQSGEQSDFSHKIIKSNV